MTGRSFEAFYSEVVGGLGAPVFERDSLAVLLIDVQRGVVDRDKGFGRQAVEAGYLDEVEQFYTRVEEIVVPNAWRLLARARSLGLLVAHSRVANQLTSGRDLSPRYKAFGLNMPGTRVEAQFHPEVEPIAEELVFSKTTSGLLGSTAADHVFRNSGIGTIIVGGVVTNNCVESSVRQLADAGYHVVLLEDMCAGWTTEGHEASIRHLDDNFATVMSTADVLQVLESWEPEVRT